LEVPEEKKKDMEDMLSSSAMSLMTTTITSKVNMFTVFKSALEQWREDYEEVKK